MTKWDYIDTSIIPFDCNEETQTCTLDDLYEARPNAIRVANTEPKLCKVLPLT